jgi:hypothetical protein
MKRVILSAIAILFALCVNAQERVFCEIVEVKSSKKSVKVTIDFGQKRAKNEKHQSLVDEKGNNIKFNSKIDALNYMHSLGWEFLQAYTEVGGSDGDTHSQIHWLLYKDVQSEENPFEGITTKEKHNKGVK